MPYAGGTTYYFTDISATYYNAATRYIYAASGNTSNGELVRITDTGAALTPVNSYNDASGTPYKATDVYVKPVTGVSDYVYVVGQAKSYLEPPPPYVVRVFSPALALQGTTAARNGFVNDITVKGTTAYVADGIGLLLVNVSNPAVPTLGAFWNTPGIAYGVDTGSGGAPTFAVVADGAIGFHTVDLTQPVSFTSKAQQGGNQVNGVAVRDGLAYVSETPFGGSCKFQVLDVSGVASGTITSRGSWTTYGMFGGGVAISGNYAFVVDVGAGLRIMDISNPAAPTQVALAAPITSSTSGRVAVQGDYAYVAANGLEVYDISNPAAPTPVGFAESDGGGINDVALSGGKAFVVDGAYFQPNSLKVLDVSTPSSPTQVAKSSTGMIVFSVSLFGDYAFIGDSMPSASGGGLRAVNINPASAAYMTAYGPCKPTNGAYDVVAYGTWAFFAEGSAGIAVADISSPTALASVTPSLETTLGTLVNAQYLALSGAYLYVCDTNTTGSSGGLVVAQVAP